MAGVRKRWPDEVTSLTVVDRRILGSLNAYPPRIKIHGKQNYWT